MFTNTTLKSTKGGVCIKIIGLCIVFLLNCSVFISDRHSIELVHSCKKISIMLAKIVFVLCLATTVFAFSKDDHDQNELINSVLSSVTNVGKELSKLVSDDPDKYSVDLNSLYKKYELASKVEHAKSFMQSQFKRGLENTNKYLKEFDEESENQFKKSVDLIKNNDPVLGEKLNKFYEKSCEVDRLVEDIVKYVLDPEKISTTFDKVMSPLHPLQRKIMEGVKKTETFIVENLPSKKKGKY